MRPAHVTDGATQKREPEQHGSAMIMAVFVLTLLTGMGVALLFLGQAEQEMGQASVRTKRAFYLAEAGLEHARSSLWDFNRNGSFDDDLIIAAGGPLDSMDFAPNKVVANRDADGNVTGFGGYGNDIPLYAMQTLDDGWYIAFLTNDPLDADPLDDENNRIVVHGVGAGSDGSFEVVSAVVELIDFLPSTPPATITLLGPSPAFNSGNSKVKRYIGTDCDGAGVPGLIVPTVGTIGSAAEADAEAGLQGNPTFQSGGFVDEDTVADLTDSGGEPTLGADIEGDWTDCQFLKTMVEGFRITADVVCADGTTLNTTCAAPPPSPTRIIFVDGDFTVGPTVEAGTLIVTGHLTLNGNADWAGLILVVGEGSFALDGAGNGIVSGGTIVADIAGPDDEYGTDDDCTGGDNGFDSVSYDEAGGGNGGSVYCTTVLDATNPVWPYEVVEFRQH